jgi:hypothetical protein
MPFSGSKLAMLGGFLLLAAFPSCGTMVTRNAGGWPNEPPGLAAATDWPFDALSGSGWSGSGGRIGIDPSAPQSPPKVWQVLYPVGFVAGLSPGQSNFEFSGAPPTRLFIGMWWRTSNPWQYQVVGDKIFYVTDVTGGGSGLFLLQQGDSHNLTITTQTGVENRTLPTVTQTPMSPGAWHRIELYLTWSTAGEGVVRLWVDGILQVDRNDVNWLNGTGFGRLHINPIWGGVGSTKLQNDFFEYDHVYISTQ